MNRLVECRSIQGRISARGEVRIACREYAGGRRGRIRSRQGIWIHSAVVKSFTVRVALFHRMHETIASDAVIENSESAANHKLGGSLPGKPNAWSEVIFGRPILDR